jgi:hypothetical protein
LSNVEKPPISAACLPTPPQPPNIRQNEQPPLRKQKTKLLLLEKLFGRPLGYAQNRWLSLSVISPETKPILARSQIG